MKRGLALLLVVGLATWLFFGGRWLILNAPEKSDAILVLGGESDVRVQRGLDLLHAGYAPRMFLDVTRVMVYGQTEAQIAQRYIDSLPPQDRTRVHLCVLDALSTFDETHAVAPCLESVGARRVLLATSEQHSRRALLIFRHELPQYQFSVAAANAPRDYGQAWWSRRQWAKTYLEESLRLFWFEAVDRWR